MGMPDGVVMRAIRMLMGAALHYQGKFPEAQAILEQCVEENRRQLGPDHQTTLESVKKLGDCFRTQQKYDQAVPLLEDAMTRAKRTLGPQHVFTLECAANLASLHFGEYLGFPHFSALFLGVLQRRESRGCYVHYFGVRCAAQLLEGAAANADPTTHTHLLLLPSLVVRRRNL
jgi:tetratricopeptide (TPR) repeat protein